MYNEYIQKHRKKIGMTQEQVAKSLRISRQTYILLEKGERNLSLQEAKDLSKIFKLTLDEFIAQETPSYRVSLVKKRKKARPKKEELSIRVTEKSLIKFKQVLLYVLAKVGSKPNVGDTVLHKLLYFIDFDYFEKYEESLMGGTYIKNHHGPTSVELASIIEDMQKKGEIEPVVSKYFKYDQKKYLPLVSADLSKLSAQEVEHIDDVLARLSDKNANEIEKFSHEDIPWKSAEEGRKISYEKVFYRDERYSVRSYADEI